MLKTVQSVWISSMDGVWPVHVGQDVCGADEFLAWNGTVRRWQMVKNVMTKMICEIGWKWRRGIRTSLTMSLCEFVLYNVADPLYEQADGTIRCDHSGNSSEIWPRCVLYMGVLYKSRAINFRVLVERVRLCIFV